MDMQQASITQLLDQSSWVFFCILARTLPLVVLVPPLYALSLSRRIRAAFAVVIALMLVPMASTNAAIAPVDWLHVGLGLGAEVMLGFLLGSIVMLSVMTLQVTGSVISQLAGFDFAVGQGINDEQQPLLASMLVWFAFAILLACGGHRLLLNACLESFAAYPVGTVCFQEAWLPEIVRILNHTFSVGLKAATPLVASLLLAHLAMGLVSRALPQLNVLAVGFNLNAIVLLVGLCVSIGGIGWVFQGELGNWIETCQRVAVDP